MRSHEGVRSTCYGACARVGLPVITEAHPRALSPVLASGELGTLRKRDGTKQVTYAGWPLY